MFDTANFRKVQTITRSVTPGKSIAAEGQLLKAVLTAGQETLEPATGAAGEALAGFAIQRALRPSTKPVVETVVADAAGAVTLSKVNLVTGTLRVRDNTAGADVVLTGATIDLVRGTFLLASVANHNLTFTYVYTLSAVEADVLFKNAPIGSNAASVWGQVTAAVGFGEISTDQYDTTKDYSVAGITLTAGANGLITVGGTGTAIPGARVVSVPTSDYPYLRISFNFAG
jgi:hypothetical protein